MPPNNYLSVIFKNSKDVVELIEIITLSPKSETKFILITELEIVKFFVKFHIIAVLAK